MLSLFVDREREVTLDSLGHPLALLDKHVDFASLPAEIDCWAPRPGQGRSAALFDRTDDAPAGAPAAVQSVRLQMEFQLLDRMSFQRFPV